MINFILDSSAFVSQTQTPEASRVHALAGRSLSLPLGICLSSRQTSHPGGGSKKGQSAIFANPFAEAVLEREMAGRTEDRKVACVDKKGRSLGDELANVTLSSDSEGYGSRAMTPSYSSILNKVQPVKLAADDAAKVSKRYVSRACQNHPR